MGLGMILNNSLSKEKKIINFGSHIIAENNITCIIVKLCKTKRRYYLDQGDVFLIQDPLLYRSSIMHSYLCSCIPFSGLCRQGNET